MKKVLVITLLTLLILNLTFAIAEPTPPAADPTNDLTKTGMNAPDPSGIKDKTNKVLENEIKLPDWAPVIAKIVFGVKEETSASLFIILLMVWVLLFLTITSILQLMPIFKGWTIWIAGIAITIISSIAGGPLLVANFFLGFQEVFDFLDEWSILHLILIIILIIILYLIIHRLLSMIKKRLERDEAIQAGEEAGNSISLLRRIFGAFKE